MTTTRTASTVTELKPTSIFIGTCERCELPSRVEIDDETRDHTFMTCLHCADDVPSVEAQRLYASTTTGECDWQCMGAVGSQCSCACGGVNHAGKWQFNYHTSEVTAEAVEKLLATRKKRAATTERKQAVKREEAAQPFNEWLSSLNETDAELISWIQDYDNLQEVQGPGHMFLIDMRLRMMARPGKEAKYPARPLTEKQLEAARKIVDRHFAQGKRKAEEALNAKPAPQGRYRVHGEVVSRRVDEEQDYRSGYTISKYKILVKCDGFKLWGNCPSDLIDVVFPCGTQEQRAADHAEPFGSMPDPFAPMPSELFVEFNATVKRSDQDESFGFFKNARSAVVSVPNSERKIPGLDITVDDAKRLSASVSAKQSKPRSQTQTETASAPVKSSARATSSHADCTHEATKSARAKCRRERSSK